MSSENDDKNFASISKPPTDVGSVGSSSERRCPTCGLEVSDTTVVCPVDNTAIFEAPGTVLADSYEFISVSGWGGMSVIYKARQRETGRIVAIKMLHSLLASDKALRRFEQEAKAITSLRHQNIIKVYDFGVSEHGQPYMVMEFIEGRTLADSIKESGSLSLEASLPRFIQLCDALDHAHAVGVLHRDLKPSNIMISNLAGAFEDAKIVDFGIAKMLDKDGSDRDVGHLTRTGELFGSPLYMSPEQCRGKPVDGRTDIYSMGCVMYETLTGHPPFSGETIVETLMMQVNNDPKPLSEVSNEKRFSREIEEVIAKALSKSPDDRYQNMREMVLALMSIQPNKQDDSQSIPTPKSRKGITVPKFVHVGTAAFILFIVVIGTWWQGKSIQLATNTKDNENEQSRLRNELQQAKHRQKFISESIQKLMQPDRKKVNDLVLKQTCSDGDLLLEELNLNDTEVTDAGTAYLPSQKSLNGVYLENTRIGDMTVRHLSQLPSLEVISLRNVHLTDHAFGNTPVFPRVWGLYLNNVKGFADESLKKISQDSALKDLDITGASFTDHGCSVLQNTDLSRLFVGHTAFGDEGIRALKNTSHLTALYFCDTAVTDAGFLELNAPALQEMDLASTKVTERGLQHLEKFPTLLKLRVSHLPFTDANSELFTKLQNTQVVNVSSTKITDKTLTILGNLPKLREVVLSGNQITDNGIEALSHSRSLELLFASDTNLTDTSLKHLGKIRTLRQLNIYQCRNMTLDAIAKFRREHPQCKIEAIDPTPTL